MTRPRPAGFTLIEVVVALFILSIGVLALVGTGRVASVSVQRAALELRVAQLIQDEAERIRTLPVDSLRGGNATRPAGEALWTVQDSGAYLRIVLVVRARPEAGRTLSDTVFVYRWR